LLEVPGDLEVVFDDSDLEVTELEVPVELEIAVDDSNWELAELEVLRDSEVLVDDSGLELVKLEVSDVVVVTELVQGVVGFAVTQEHSALAEFNTSIAVTWQAATTQPAARPLIEAALEHWQA